MSPIEPAESSDLVLCGGVIRTLDAGCPRPDALLVRRGRVAACGGRDLLDAVPPARRVDLGGATVVPGLVDAHAHLLGLGRMRSEVDLRDAASFEDVIGRIAAAARARPAGSFVLGRGWNQARWPGGALPRHERLSEATPQHPVLLRRVDGHATLANAEALRRGRIDASTRSPEGGEIVRDPAGLPTGLFVDRACELLPKPPAPGDDDLERDALAAQEACLAAGLTGVHDAGVDERSLAAIERLGARGRLRLRLHVMLEADFEDGGGPRPWLARRLAAGPVAGACDGRLSVRALKVFLDGALGSRGAALLLPYADRPDSSGLFLMDRAALVRRVRACRDAGFQACVHAIGDAANRLVLDVYEEVLGDAASSDHRWRIEHAQVVAPEDVARFGRLGVVAAVQPLHATSDRGMAEERLGAERLGGAYAWRSLARGGARLALGSDFPVESENPLWGILAATARTDPGGEPRGGWRAEESLTREEALRGYTLGAAFASFTEGELGSLGPGRRADFVVLPEDPLTCPASSLSTLRPLATWIGGRKEFSAP